MSEERRNPQNTESDESGLLLSVDPMSERSLDSAALTFYGSFLLRLLGSGWTLTNQPNLTCREVSYCCSLSRS